MEGSLLNAIPLSPDGADRVAVLRIVPQLAADVADVYHHQIVGGVEIRFVPYALINVLRREDLARVRGQQVQDAVFNIRQRDLLLQ